ncbi:MAG: ABC transporter ATP-binding protein [bacterium]|nr:ABC transporter ATP-binding protein [bacterium]
MWDDEDLFSSEEDEAQNQGSLKKLLGGLLPYFAKYRIQVITATLLLLFCSVLTLFGPLLLRQAIDVDIKTSNIPGLVRTSLIYLILQAMIVVIGYFMNISLATVGEKTVMLLKENLYKHILKLPMSFFDKNPAGKLLSRVESDTEVLKSLFTGSAVGLTQDLVMLVGMSVVMIILNVKLYLAVFILLPPFFYMFQRFQKKIRPVYRNVRKVVSEINNFIKETLQDLVVVQIFNRQDYFATRMDKLSSEKYKQDYETSRLWSRLWFNVDFGEVLGLALVLSIGGLWALKGWITIGTLVLFVSYISRLFMPVRGLSEQLNLIQRAFASSERIFTVMDVPTEPEVKESLFLPSPELESPIIEFKKVNFAYEGRDWVLKDISLSIKKGEKIAFVGETGGGKTSIISLLLKFYIPQSGEILLRNRKLAEIDTHILRHQIGFVPQDVILFPGSVFDNLRLFNEKITMEQVISATQKVQIHNIILNFPQGYETDLLERGINLSIGERQLLSFARALVFAPEILILDEATSSIDPHTERLIQEGLKELLKDRTAIIIAHRLITTRKVDRIVVIHSGAILEQGTHIELLRQKGYYYKLHKLQYLGAGSGSKNV